MYENIHDFWYRTIKYFPENTFIHKQDIFLKQNYSGDELPSNTFLQKATLNHFKGREYYTHLSLLFIGNSGKSTLKKSGVSNPFKNLPKKEKLEEEFGRDNAFMAEITKSIDFLNSSRHIKATPLTEEEIHTLIQNYYNGFDKDKYVDTDLEIKVQTQSKLYNAIGIGDKRVGVFAINNINQFPEHVDIFKLDTQYSSQKFQIFKGFSDDFGIKLPCNHIYNQILYIDDHSRHRQELETRKEHLQGAKGFGSDNEVAAKNLIEYLNELSKDETKKIVRGHSNVIYYASTDAEFEKCTNLISTIYRNLDFKPHYPNKTAIKEIYLKSIFPFVSTLSNQNVFRSELQVALSSFLNTTSYKSDEEGVIFSDRIFNIPIKRDIRDLLKKRIKAWNFFIIAPTGEGKSVLAQHVFRQLNEFGYKIVIFDIGGSFKKLSYLVPKEKSIFLSYENGKPLGLNPFHIKDSTLLDVDKKNALAEFIFNLWRPEEALKNEYRRPLVKIIEAYYLNIGDKHHFPSFYQFIKENEKTLLSHLGIQDRFFDIEEFLFSCSAYVNNGQYSFLFDPSQKLDFTLEDKDLIVFEFDKAKEDTILLSLLMRLGNEAVRKIILDDRGVSGVVFYDELAKFIKNKNIRDIVTHYYQTNRKHAASIGTAIQTPDQLPIGPDTNAMIENSQILYILFNEKGYQPIVDRFKLSEHQHNLLKSLIPRDKNAKGNTPTEFALIIGKYIWILKVELSIENFYAFQTDGEHYAPIMELFNKTEDMEKAITAYVENTI